MTRPLIDLSMTSIELKSPLYTKSSASDLQQMSLPRILITGGTGFVGSAIVAALIATEKYDIYFAVGTEVTASDLVASDVGFRSSTTGDIDAFLFYDNGPVESDFYLDKFQILSELNEFVPEPASFAMIGIGGLGLLLIRRLKRRR